MKCEILTCFIKCDIDAMIKNLLNLQISVCIFFSSIKFFFFSDGERNIQFQCN